MTIEGRILETHTHGRTGDENFRFKLQKVTRTNGLLSREIKLSSDERDELFNFVTD